MPLIKSGSKEVFKRNLSKLLAEGKDREQSIAIALSVAREHGADWVKAAPKKKKG